MDAAQGWDVVSREIYAVPAQSGAVTTRLQSR